MVDSFLFKLLIVKHCIVINILLFVLCFLPCTVMGNSCWVSTMLMRRLCPSYFVCDGSCVNESRKSRNFLCCFRETFLSGVLQKVPQMFFWQASEIYRNITTFLRQLIFVSFVILRGKPEGCFTCRAVTISTATSPRLVIFLLSIFFVLMCACMFVWAW